MRGVVMIRHAAVTGIAVAAFVLCLGNEGCSHTDPLNLLTADSGGTPSIANPDAAPLQPDASVLTSYCPSSACPAPFTTCPGSRYLCDVNLLNDPLNCGSCGFACPTGDVLGGRFQCVEGQCKLACSVAYTTQADCDGIVDNGCEVSLGSNDNCQTCGDKCTDPAKPCVADATGNHKCGCGAGLIACGGFQPCVDPTSSDSNCGGCGTHCTASGDGGPRPPHSHYGCAGSECGHLKCDAGYDDCDGDLSSPTGNGCEAYLKDSSTCGSCKTACAAGQSCGVNYQNGGAVECMCGPGKQDCGTPGYPFCVDIDTDSSNCGGCGNWCGVYYIQNGVTLSHYDSRCTSGVCTLGCEQGWADCNGNLEDGCEVNTSSDPANCGACGETCGAIYGQACVTGQCALEPCDSADGGITK